MTHHHYPKYSFLVAVILTFFSTFSFPLAAQKHYQGLMWQISGNGLTRPSYLYGTMHVSEKVAFHLSDSFFIALAGVDVVSLETNPETWMDDMMSEEYRGVIGYYLNNRKDNTPTKEGAFALEKNLKPTIRQALSEDLDLVNGLLFRNEKAAENFEEDTYLDLYIYQTGKRLHKTLTGVENFQEVMRLSQEASKEAAKDRSPRKSFHGDMEQIMYDAYRRADLDLMDSLQRLSSGKAYLEKMLYQRNRNMVRNMDSIMKKSSLFVAVGAAHLPCENGVIELLRQKGYTVRAVQKGERASKQKKLIDEKKYTLTYATQTTQDGFVKVDLPGKLHELPPQTRLQYYLYPEYVNGAFYSLARIKTYSDFIDLDENKIYKMIDSLLYENIPGEIVSKKAINRSGYAGFDILNRTRNGNYQRYQLYVTPFEILVFKLGGTKDFAKGKDSDIFFNSIQLQVHKPLANGYIFSPEHGEFEVKFPHKPFHNVNFSRTLLEYPSRNDYQAKEGKTCYFLMEKTFYHQDYIDEDTFELTLLTDGFAETKDYKILSQSFGTNNKVTCKDVLFRCENGDKILCRAMISGIYYYLLAVKMDSLAAQKVGNFDEIPFFSSFHFKTLTYKKAENYEDTAFHFTVQTCIKPTNSLMDGYRNWQSNNEIDYNTQTDNKDFYDVYTGEKVEVEFCHFHRYKYIKDSAAYWTEKWIDETYNNDFLRKDISSKTIGDKIEILSTFADTASQRIIRKKWILQGEALYTLTAIGSENEPASPFVQTFFDTFSPDSMLGKSIFTDRSARFLQDLLSPDTLIHRPAMALLYQVSLAKANKKDLLAAWENFSMPPKPKTEAMYLGEKRSYTEIRAKLLRALAYQKDTELTEFVKKMYYEKADTVEYQLAILEGLASHKDTASFSLLKTLLLSETPLPSTNNDLQNLFDILSDTLPLAASLFPDILSLTTLDEYETNVYTLLQMLLDSNEISKQVYQNQQTTLLNEARISLKRKVADEQQDRGYDSESLQRYVTLLLPFYAENSGVKLLFEKIMRLKMQRAKMEIAIEMLKNKLPVPDSIWQSLAKNDRFRVDLYNHLEKIQRLDLFPALYKTPEAICKSIVAKSISNWTYQNLDTLYFLQKIYTKFRDKEGYIFIYKYKAKDAVEWSLALTGLQPKDSTQFDAQTDEVSLSNYSIEAGKKTENEQITEMVKYAKIRARKYRAFRGDYADYE